MAIPLFGSEVAPRFRFAGRLLLADLEDGKAVAQRILSLGDLGWRARLSLLAQEGVTLLICGGFHGRYLPFIQGQGIRVSWGHTGLADALVECACRGEIQSLDPELGRGCRRRRRGRRGRR